MNSQFNSDEDVLAQLIRKAGDPTVTPDPNYEEKLRTTVLDRVGRDAQEESTASEGEVLSETGSRSILAVERNRPMRDIARIAIAATVLMALSVVAIWGVGAGSANLAFAEVAKVLDGLRSATYDFTTEFKNPADGKSTTIKSEGYFQAPGLERVESETSFGFTPKTTHSILILDCLAAKGIALLPEQKKALVINISTTENSTGGTAHMFEMVKQLVRQGTTDSSEKVESVGTKTIDGKTVVGFRTQNNMADITLWADPQTARLVRVEYDMHSGGGQSVMSNIRYDTDLDPSLFSLVPPAGYTVETQTVKTPTEMDFISLLRLVAEFNDDTFPDSVGTNEKTFILALQAETKAESEKLLKSPKAQQLMEKIKAQYGDDKAAGMKAWMKEWTEMAEPITRQSTQKYMQGTMFYAMLQPENDSHYAGKDVKLNTPNRPIFWYKPTGADKYRVLYADLSTKEMSPEDVKEFPESEAE